MRAVIKEARPCAITMKEVEDESIKDEEIINIQESLISGNWLEEMRKFELLKEEFSSVGLILLRGTRIFMPTSLRDRTLKLAHEGHPGIVAMKKRLREKVWWHGLYKNVENEVKSCKLCLLDQLSNHPQPMKRRELPSEPWKDIAIDILDTGTGDHVLMTIDYYSRYKLVSIMNNLTSMEVLRHLRSIFTLFGYPVTITADNGRQFISQEFFSYCKEKGIIVNNTIPYWPQMNGLVERQNRTLMARIRKSVAEDRDWKLDLEDYLIMYRSTPQETTGKSPAELMFGRNIRDKLPCLSKLLNKFDDEEVRDKDREMKDKGKTFADKKLKAQETDIQVGDQVILKNLRKLNKLEMNYESEYFEVMTLKGSDTIVKGKISGKILRRKIAHLKKIPKNLIETNLNKSEDKENC